MLGIDELGQIQALDRTLPGLSLKKGRCRTIAPDDISSGKGNRRLYAAPSASGIPAFFNKVDDDTPPISICISLLGMTGRTSISREVLISAASPVPSVLHPDFEGLTVVDRSSIKQFSLSDG